ncbi:NAD(P)/FAD-dependent oxidoreductase [Brevibacillus humidisoli]|uniref:FAD-dependent oxidoreductase n=1 Tax=Brevibacillus humidisoli TaxID=2895522 RepID=UPI001E4C5D20|nr:NAD(P)/FAD-dependent oxidoreductase [Brevibacillus humidisoli]UFJ39618.1 NAD(P)/FAD-dependent oxidoreductase [Brevibacillus humidisoli]
MNKRKLVLVGNGMAGINVIEHVMKLAREQFEITVIGKEPHPNYNRILLSSVLAGDANMADIVLNDWDWYKQHGIRLHTGTAVTDVDTDKQVVVTDTGLVVPYDGLILATGSLPFMLPVPGVDLEGVIAFRDIKDCETMIEAAKSYQNAVVIGGGLLGLEAARGLLNLKMNVSVVHIYDTLMERQLDRTAAEMLKTELERQGMNFLLEKQTERIIGDRRVAAVEFTDGTRVEADLVVMAVGIRPNATLAKESGITVNRGIVVDEFMRTSAPHVYAVGECAEHRGVVYGLVAPLQEQGAVLAKHLCQVPTEPYQGSVVATKLKVSGVDVHLTHTREVMHVLGWSNPEGCSKCRPAVNYYLGMVWPEQYEDERESRFVNERLHANIQNDGTYSVVPRMYGGVTSAAELKRIAEVAEKYQVRMIKLTGGQRIDLLGVSKEDLPNIWSELGMPSGYAYGKAIRTVKTCVGSDFCRFGTQNSIQLGIDIEKNFERLQTPAKVKMAVSACPRNCAESGIKDLGVVGVDGGWEIYVGGNGGVKLRAADLLCKVKTTAEVLDIAGAYLQYYRETGKYGERTSEWVERLGLESIRNAVVEDHEQRTQLLARIEVALAQWSDPWQEVISSESIRSRFYQGTEVTSHS